LKKELGLVKDFNPSSGIGNQKKGRRGKANLEKITAREYTGGASIP